MAQPPKDLSQLPYFDEAVKLDRTSLKEQAAEILRDHITAGRIPEGTRLTERQVSQMLGISRIWGLGVRLCQRSPECYTTAEPRSR